MLKLPSVQQILRTTVLILIIFATARFMPENVKQFFRV